VTIVLLTIVLSISASLNEIMTLKFVVCDPHEHLSICPNPISLKSKVKPSLVPRFSHYTCSEFSPEIRENCIDVGIGGLGGPWLPQPNYIAPITLFLALFNYLLSRTE